MSEPTVLTFTLTYAATLGVAALMFLDQVIAFTAILGSGGSCWPAHLWSKGNNAASAWFLKLAAP